MFNFIVFNEYMEPLISVSSDFNLYKFRQKEIGLDIIVSNDKYK